MNHKNLMEAINCRVIPVTGYIMNVCVIRKGELDELDKMVKDILRKENSTEGRQAMNGYTRDEKKAEED